MKGRCVCGKVSTSHPCWVLIWEEIKLVIHVSVSIFTLNQNCECQLNFLDTGLRHNALVACVHKRRLCFYKLKQPNLTGNKGAACVLEEITDIVLINHYWQWVFEQRILLWQTLKTFFKICGAFMTRQNFNSRYLQLHSDYTENTISYI